MPGFLFSLTTPALIGLLITASALVVTNDWRVGFVALAVQYLFAATLIAQIVVWQVVAVKLLVGFMVVGILTFTGGQMNFGLRPGVVPDLRSLTAAFARFEIPTGFPFRLVAVTMVIVVAGYLANQPRFALPGLSAGLNFASYLLLTLGLLNLGLTEEPMNAGIGLLTLLTGFEMFYAAIEPSLAIVALLAAVDFGVALAVSYLALLRYAVSEKESSR